ncbi:MAG TPA: lipoyl(octanoyl) transferase LipB, partial [Dehalococcoidia bacterium]
LVGYPVLDLRRRGILPGDYVRLLEAALIDAMASFGINAARVPGRPGVWAGGDKLASIGVRVRGGITTHGFALNVSNDLSWFDAIVPCGLHGVRMTSMATLLGHEPAMAEVEDAVVSAIERAFSAPFGESNSTNSDLALAGGSVGR